MELIFLLILLALFLLPTFFAVRRQQKHQKEILAFQASLAPGKRVVTAAGIHGTVTAVRDTEVDLEIASGTTVTFEKIAIVRAAGTADSLNGATSARQVNAEPAPGEADGYRAGEFEPGYESGHNAAHPDDAQRER